MEKGSCTIFGPVRVWPDCRVDLSINGEASRQGSMEEESRVCCSDVGWFAAGLRVGL